MLSFEASIIGHCQDVRLDGLLDYAGDAILSFKNIYISYMNLCKKLLQCYVCDLRAWKSKEFFYFWLNPFLVFILLILWEWDHVIEYSVTQNIIYM